MITGAGSSNGYPMVKIFRSDNQPIIIEVFATGSSGNMLYHTGEGIDWSPAEDLIVWPGLTSKYNPQLGMDQPVGALVLLRPVTGGQPTWLTNPPLDYIYYTTQLNRDMQMDYRPCFSPDGTKIAYVRSLVTVTSFAGFNTPSIRIINKDGTNDHVIATFGRGEPSDGSCVVLQYISFVQSAGIKE